MKSLVAKLINFSSRRAFLRSTEAPLQAYATMERSILNTLAGSSFWQKELGASIDSLAIENFPITDYEFYRGPLEGALADGVKNPLNGEEILFWCKSSGTSAKPKFFPLTTSYRQDLLRVSRAFSFEVANLLGPSLNNRLLFIPSAASGEKTAAGIEVGMISRFMYLNQPKLVKRGWAIPEAAMASDLILDEWGPAYGMAYDIGAFMATVPSIITQFMVNLEQRKEELFALVSGGKPWPKSLPRPGVSPARLKQIEKTLAAGRVTFKNLWPSLTLINAWKSSTAGLQAPKVDAYNQGHALFADAIYSATEGWMTVPRLDSDQPGCPLHCGAVYVEFADVEDIQSDVIDPGKLRKPWELVVGREYEVVLSQRMGFIRYRLRDVVRCTGFFARAPLLVFQHKSGNQISLGHTRVSEVNVLEAIRQSGFEHDQEWTLAPSADGMAMDFYTPRSSAKLVEDVRRLDATLARVNPDILDDYERGRLRPMAVRELRADHPFWRAGKHGQAKMRVITREPLGD